MRSRILCCINLCGVWFCTVPDCAEMSIKNAHRSTQLWLYAVWYSVESDSVQQDTAWSLTPRGRIKCRVTFSIKEFRPLKKFCVLFIWSLMSYFYSDLKKWSNCCWFRPKQWPANIFIVFPILCLKAVRPPSRCKNDECRLVFTNIFAFKHPVL